MTEDKKHQKIGEITGKTVDGYLKGAKCCEWAGGKNYSIEFPKPTTTVVSIIDNTKNTAVIRLDTPHKFHEYNHININPKISGVKDPHIPISGVTLKAGTAAAKVAKALNNVNKVLLPVAIAANVIQTGKAIYRDCKNGTSRKTVETIGNIAGGWGGGYGGAAAGAALGTVIFPGVGTIVGMFVGGLSGGIGGALATGGMIGAIGDAAGYNIIRKCCQKCGKYFNIRIYEGDDCYKFFCDKCQ